MSYLDEESILFKLNTDRDGNPTSTITTEQQQVDTLKNLIQLVQLPDHLQNIEVTDSKGQRMIQVRNTDAVLKDNEIRVSFNQGLIFFSPNRKGETFTIKYYARGIELISTNRLFSPEQPGIPFGDVIQQVHQSLDTLKGVIDDARDELNIIEETHGGLIPAYNHLKEATAEGERVNATVKATNETAKQTNTTLIGNISTGRQVSQDLASKSNVGGQIIKNLQDSTATANQTNSTLNATIQTGNGVHTTLTNDIKTAREVDTKLVADTNEAKAVNKKLESNTDEIVRWKDYSNDTINVNYPRLDIEVQSLNAKVKVLEDDSIESTPYNNQMVDAIFPNLHLNVDKLDKKVNDTKQAVDMNVIEVNKLKQSVDTLNKHNHNSTYLGINATAQNSLKLGGASASVAPTPNTIVKRDAQGRINVAVASANVSFLDETGEIESENISDAIKEIWGKTKQGVETRQRTNEKLSECGNWTPTSCDNSAISILNSKGNYTRIQNQINLVGEITFSIEEEIDTFEIEGLPFALGESDCDYVGTCVDIDNSIISPIYILSKDNEKITIDLKHDDIQKSELITLRFTLTYSI